MTVKTSFADTEAAIPPVELPEPYAGDLRDLWLVWDAHRAAHAERRDRLKNIGIAIPDELSGVPIVEVSLGADGAWSYRAEPHSMGRPLMEPLAYNADLDYPLGRSRITRAVMNITDRAVRESLRTELASEFAATPQKYLLGGTEEDMRAALEGKTRWEMYIGSVQWATKDEDGDVPQYGQLPQVSMQPHMDYFEHLAEEFAAETDIPVDALVRSSTYTSADSAAADRTQLVQIAEDLNEDNGAALRSMSLRPAFAGFPTGR